MAKAKFYSAAGRALSRMTHKDLQRACVVRGLAFEKVVELDVPGLTSWFAKEHDRTQDLNLLNMYDLWKDEQLKPKHPDKDDPFYHPSLRLGYVGRQDEEGNVTHTKKPRGAGLMKKKKSKRQRDEKLGIFLGTKKALTFQCQKDGKTIPETVVIVTAKFPEAQEKSINIWYKKCAKLNKK